LCARVLNGLDQPAATLVPAGCRGYAEPPGCALDYDRARALLAGAGFAGGKGLAPVTLEVGAGLSEPQIAEVLQAGWRRELGVTVNIEQVESKTHYANMRSLQYGMGGWGWVADYPDPYSFLEAFRTGNGNNWTGWSNRDYDALLDRANQSADAAQRFELLRQAETLLLAEAPIAPVRIVTHANLVAPQVKNWNDSAMRTMRLHHISLEN